jgi:hypothetical protein
MTATLEDCAPFTNAKKHVVVPVPWDRADSIRNRLSERGITSIACYDPQDRQASIEICQDIDLHSIQDVLR